MEKLRIKQAIVTEKCENNASHVHFIHNNNSTRCVLSRCQAEWEVNNYWRAYRIFLETTRDNTNIALRNEKTIKKPPSRNRKRTNHIAVFSSRPS